eukprot:CFRG2521T1
MNGNTEVHPAPEVTETLAKATEGKSCHCCLRNGINNINIDSSSVKHKFDKPASMDGWVNWTATVDKIVPAVVALKVTSVRAIDTNAAVCSVATGFVVDKERGILLTNRHVIGPGPSVSEATFSNHEEVTVRAVYTDPVHDFGFFKFDPADVKFMDVVEIPLAPEGAEVGADIRVVGNDAGEKLSILSGTIARLDREAPQYIGYTDFNTFYYQAASGTSGGSSGSPVVDALGRAIALNAGGKKKSASSFYLPLDRVVRALSYIQKGESVPRGTIQTVFKCEPYDVVRRLGLTAILEKQFRKQFPEAIGMLVVKQVVPVGPGFGLLRPGDILILINGEFVSNFVALETFLDGNVGSKVSMSVQRGGCNIIMDIPVQDLHALTPSRFLEIGDCIFHDVSYQLARANSIPCQGVYVSKAGYILRNAHVGKNVVVMSVGGIPTPNLIEFEKAVLSLHEGSKKVFRFQPLSDRHREATKVVTINWKWHRVLICQREPSFGHWTIDVIKPPSEVAQVDYGSRALNYRSNNIAAQKVGRSFVMVDFKVPHAVSGVCGKDFEGCGVILDAKLGLVCVDRDTVPIALGDVNLSFGGAVEVPAEVVFLHPVHNFAIVKYDPANIGDTAVESAEFDPTEAEPGDELTLVGLTNLHQLISRTCTITKIQRMVIKEMSPPRYRSVNVDVAHVDNPLASQGGVLVDTRGRISYFWYSFSYQRGGESFGQDKGMPTTHVQQALEMIRNERELWINLIDCELCYVQLAEAKSQGLPAKWQKQIQEKPLENLRSNNNLLSVRRLFYGSHSSKRLKEGDLVLAMNGNLVNNFVDFEESCRHVDHVQMEVLRDGKVLNISVQVDRLWGGCETTKVVHWSGALLQTPHRAVKQQSTCPSEIYCSWWSHGSPAERYGLHATVFITEVNDVVVKTIDDFLDALDSVEDKSFIRLRTMNLNTKDAVLTILPDYHFWPTWVIKRNGTRWIAEDLVYKHLNPHIRLSNGGKETYSPECTFQMTKSEGDENNFQVV